MEHFYMKKYNIPVEATLEAGNSSVIMISRSILIRLIMRLTARIRWIFTWW